MISTKKYAMEEREKYFSSSISPSARYRDHLEPKESYTHTQNKIAINLRRNKDCNKVRILSRCSLDAIIRKKILAILKFLL